MVLAAVLLLPGGLALHERLLIRPSLEPRLALARDGCGRLGWLAALVCVAACCVGLKVSHGARRRFLKRAAARESVARCTADSRTPSVVVSALGDDDALSVAFPFDGIDEAVFTRDAPRPEAG
jgi:hypothetical protein